MAYVPVPKDLSKVKTKVAFNLTKRQIVCFAVALLLGLAAARKRSRKPRNQQSSPKRKAIQAGLCFSLSWHFLAAGARSIILSL